MDTDRAKLSTDNRPWSKMDLKNFNFSNRNYDSCVLVCCSDFGRPGLCDNKINSAGKARGQTKRGKLLQYLEMIC